MQQPRIAYFSMEIGFHPDVPTYSGGLGVLAGDTVRSAADLRVPMVAVTPVHRKGYFVQELAADGSQRERPSPWNVEQHLEPMKPIVCVQIENRNVLVRAWRYIVKGSNGNGGEVPIYLLDTDLPDNRAQDRTLTDHLYGGDLRYRLSQEIVLGIGGVRMLRALGYHRIERFHLNEGHAALLTLELLNEQIITRGVNAEANDQDVAAVRRQCVFTTHTPVPAGHDRFPIELVDQVLGGQGPLHTHTNAFENDHLNMTHLALDLSQFANAVAKRHGEVSRHMFPKHHIHSITNGVHAGTWASDSFAALFDRHLGGWRGDNARLRLALGISNDELWSAHEAAKRLLIDHVNQHNGAGFSVEHFTLGFARRAATYKRADLLVSDVDRLKDIARRHGPMQVIYAGKAHPHDGGGKDIIRRVHQAMAPLAPDVKLIYLPNYEMRLGRLVTAGVDVWLNTPRRPLEASGTSGMKAALNGVPSLSVLDGWWVEGCIEAVTGWAIGPDDPRPETPQQEEQDREELYRKLDGIVLPMFHRQRESFIHMMKQSIAINGAHFNTHRMVQEYVVRAYVD